MSGRVSVVRVREATDADREALTLHEVAASAEGAMYRGALMELAPAGEMPRAQIALVAEIAGEVVGSLTGDLLEEATWLIRWVYTAPEARGIGVADALMDRFRHVTAERGASKLLSRALPGDRETKNLFERHGFTAQMIVLGTTPPELNEPQES